MEPETCRQLLYYLSDYVDGELEENLCAEIEKHMLECERCQIVLDTLNKTIYLYRSSTAQESLPEGVRLRLYKRLELEEFLET